MYTGFEPVILTETSSHLHPGYRFPTCSRILGRVVAITDEKNTRETQNERTEMYFETHLPRIFVNSGIKTHIFLTQSYNCMKKYSRRVNIFFHCYAVGQKFKTIDIYCV